MKSWLSAVLATLILLAAPVGAKPGDHEPAEPRVVDRAAAAGFTKRALAGGLHSDEIRIALQSLREQPAAPYSPAELDALEARATTGKLDDNDAAAVCVGFFTGVFAPSFLGALIPNPLGLDIFFGVASYSSNLALKFCPPVMSAPADISVSPNRDADAFGNQCGYDFTQERMAGSFESILGIPASPVGSNWPGSAASPGRRGIGTPQGVFHFNTDVNLRLVLPGSAQPGTDGDALLADLSSAVLPAYLSATLGAAVLVASQIDWGDTSGCSDNGDVAFDNLGLPCPYVKGRRIRLPVGTHTATWRGDTMFQLLDVVYVYVPGFPNGTKWKKAKEFLVNVFVELLQIGAGEVTKKYALGVQSLRSQTIRVLDTVPPVLTPTLFNRNQSQPYLVEATSPGGEYSNKHVRPILESYSVRENCGRNVKFPAPATPFFWPVNTDADNPNQDPDRDVFLTYRVEDLGPATSTGGTNGDSDEVWIRVVDTEPPEVLAPPDIVMLSATGPVSVDPGIPQVFDVADLEPRLEVSLNGGAFTETVPTSFAFGQNTLVWRAVDASGNVSNVNEERASQLVNVKPSNVAPVANAQTGNNAVDIVSFRKQEILLTGSDGDFDPLSFRIEQPPEKGFFDSPLLPYFVSDFRVEGQQSLDDMRAGCASNPRVEPSLNRISNPQFFTTDDEGITYVIDTYYECRTQDNDVNSRRRIAKFSPDGEVIAQRDYSQNVNRISIDPEGRVLFVSSGSGINDHAITLLDQDLEDEARYSLNDVAPTYAAGAFDPELCDDPNRSMSPIDEIYAAVIDPQGIIYSADRRGRLLAYDSQDTNFGEAAYIGSLTGCNDFFFGRVDDIALDGEGNVYLSDRTDHRIHKFTASYFDEAGAFVPGKFVGWAGKCIQDTAPGDEAVCIFDNPSDPADGHSLGFSCTDEFCGPPRSGTGDGQFNDPRGIDIDPKDVLYVLDRANRRVQRFTSDGLFAGKAESECDASFCFAIGDFGVAPRDVNVNSSNFYVLDNDTDILHIFATSVVERVNDTTARVVYQTDDNYQNTTDFFTFSTTDGVLVDGEFVMSAPARVDLNLGRNFRPPVATPFIAAMTEEDTSVPILLDGSDPDAPLDILNFGVAAQPANGTVTISGATATYRPDPDYFGIDVFEFFATDGTSQSAPEPVAVSVAPVNDPPLVDVDAVTQVGRGYKKVFEAAFDDPDPEDEHLVVVNWGDGIVEPEGEQLEDGTLTGPVLDQSPNGNGSLRAEHVFGNNGNFAVELCATDRVVLVGENKQPTPDSLTTCGRTTARVVDMADLNVAFSDLDRVTSGGSEFFRIDAGYAGPDSGTGVTATGVVIDLVLDGAATIVVMDPSAGTCSFAGTSGTCTLNPMAPETTVAVDVGLAYAPDQGPGAEVDIEARVRSDFPDPNGGDQAFATVTRVLPADFLVTASPGDADLPDQNPGDGICATSEDVCTLRAAIQESAASGSAKTIGLGGGTYLLNREAMAKRLKASDEDDGNEGDLDIRSSVTIRGIGPDRTVVDGFGKDRVFDIHSGDVTIRDLTIAGGDVAADDNGGDDPWARLGGGMLVRSAGEVRLRNVAVTSNASRSLGGGIAHIGTGELSLRRSAVYGNRSTSNGGGGLFVSGPTSLRNTTISGNVAAGNGGGFAVESASSGTATLVLEHATIAGNEAGAEGGGVYRGSATGPVTFSNTLVASNVADIGSDCVGEFASLGGNLIGDDQTSGTGNVTCTLSGGSADQTGVRALIDDLETTALDASPVHELRANSPAVGAALAATCASLDQRGLDRADPAGGGGCDIGAVAFTDLVFRSGFGD